MNGLLNLTQRDFLLQQGPQGGLLCTRIKGLSLVLFYTNQCTYCHTLIPIFKQLPNNIGGAQFGIVNLSNNKDIVHISNQTIVPIKVVPFLILYLEGKPFLRYDGERSFEAIRKFIFDVTNNLKAKQQFVNNHPPQQQQQQQNYQNGHASEQVHNRHQIPLYSEGRPKSNDDELCYLVFNDSGYMVNPED
jgi:thiol-disulfide isomerase/thioredoxin